MKKQVEEWLHFAEIDIRSAKKLGEEKYLAQAAAFHIHQCVEKSIKAILEDKQQKIPKIHNLVVLMESIRKLGVNPQIDEDILDEINQIYIESRYPADFGVLPGGTPSIEIIKKFLDFATEFFSFADKLIRTGMNEETSSSNDSN
jgi:HEPN domain-containing protein